MELDTLAVARLSVRLKSTTYSRVTHGFWAGLGVLALCLTLLICFITYIPPLQDYGDWVYQGYLTNSLVSGVHTIVTFKHWPVPNVLSQFSLAGLMYLVKPIVAAKLFVTLYLVVAGLVGWIVSNDSHDRITNGLTFLLVVALAIIHAPFWTGEINYQFGLLLLLIYVYWIGAKRKPNIVVDCLYGLLLFTCHAMCLGIFMLYVGFRSLIERRIWRACLSLAPVVVLLAWYVVADPRHDYFPSAVAPKLHGIKDWLFYQCYIFAKIGPYQNLVFADAGDYERLRPMYFCGVLINFLFAGCMGVIFLRWVSRSISARLFTPELLTAVTCATIAVINPASSLGIANAGERFIYPAMLICMLMLAKDDLWKRIAGVLASFLLVYLIYVAAVIPKEPSPGGIPKNDIVNRPDARYHLLFWHRPFMYFEQVDAAQRAATAGGTPTARVAFETSILARKSKQ
jgi:hypothetical protein